MPGRPSEVRGRRQEGNGGMADEGNKEEKDHRIKRRRGCNKRTCACTLCVMCNLIKQELNYMMCS